MSSVSSQSVFVGLDYHSQSVQVCVLGRRRQDAGESGVRERSADLAEELIARAGWSVDLAHPGYVARIKQSPDKTDFSDARLLAAW